MFRIKKFKTGRTVIGLILLGLATILGLAELYMYYQYGTTIFSPNYSTYAIAGMIVGIASGFLGLITLFRPFAFIAYLAYLYALIHYIISQVNLLANILYGVDGSVMPMEIPMTITIAVLTIVLSLFAGIFIKKRKAEKD